MKNEIPGQVLVPAQKKFKTSWFLVGSWLTWFRSYPNRAESKSPERYTGSSVLRGRDTYQGPAPLNRTQSAAHVPRKPRSISVDTDGKDILIIVNDNNKT